MSVNHVCFKKPSVARVNVERGIAVATSIGSVLTSYADWSGLLTGETDAIRLAQFATPAECETLAALLVSHPRSVDFSTAAGITRVGSSFSDIRKTGRVRELYSEKDVLEEFLLSSPVIARLYGQIAASWPAGVETLTFDGLLLHRFVGRRIVGGGAEPHDDNIAKELPGHAVAAEVSVQLGVNLYVETPNSGGELEGWRRRLSAAEYDSMRNSEPKLSYGVNRAQIGLPDWTIKPTTGDVIVFRNSELHAIHGSSEPRSTCGFFLGFRSPDKPLVMWS